VRRAAQVVGRLVSHESWRDIFSDGALPSTIRRRLEVTSHLDELRDAAHTLTSMLSTLPRPHPKDPMVMLHFDEAGSLLETTTRSCRNGRYLALTCIMSCCREWSIWFLILTRHAVLREINPEDRRRVKPRSKQVRFAHDDKANPAFTESLCLDSCEPPLVSMTNDLYVKVRVTEPDKYAREFTKPMAEFSQWTHLSSFGRPLWGSLVGAGAEAVRAAAKAMLLDGLGTTFSPATDTQQVFAVLAALLDLEIWKHRNPATAQPFEEKAVSRHARVIVEAYVGYIKTGSADPVLALAAWELLNSDDSFLPLSLEHLGDMLHDGMTSAGQRGQMYARLLVLLARNSFSSALLQPSSDSTACPTFTVREFLHQLYNSDHHALIDAMASVDGGDGRQGRSGAKLLDANMNFMYFERAEHKYALHSDDDLSELCHVLLRRCAAMHLVDDLHGFSERDTFYDVLLPYYSGGPHAPFERSFCGAIVVRVRNIWQPRPLEYIFGRSFSRVSVSVPGGERVGYTTTTTATATTVEAAAESAEAAAAEKAAAAAAAEKVTASKQPLPGAPPSQDWHNVFCRSPDFTAFCHLRNPVLLLLVDIGEPTLGAKSTEAPGLAPVEIGYVMDNGSGRGGPDSSGRGASAQQGKEGDGATTAAEAACLSPRVFVIHSRGHGADVFGCLAQRSSCADVAAYVFRSGTPDATDESEIGPFRHICRFGYRPGRYCLVAEYASLDEDGGDDDGDGRTLDYSAEDRGVVF
jgi:hypothetical protein